LTDFQELAIPRALKGSMGEMDFSAMADIKAAITSKTTQGREMYAMEQGVEPQHSAFVSSSNVHVFNILQDPGGMRRFWEFSLKPSKFTDPREKWEKANKMFEYMEQVYQAIDENDTMGFYYDNCPHFEEITRVQNSYSKADAISRYLDKTGQEIQGHADEEEGFKQVSVPKFVSMFNRVQEREGNGKWKTYSVVALLSQKDITPERITKDGKVTEYLYIKEKV